MTPLQPFCKNNTLKKKMIWWCRVRWWWTSKSVATAHGVWVVNIRRVWVVVEFRDCRRREKKNFFFYFLKKMEPVRIQPIMNQFFRVGSMTNSKIERNGFQNWPISVQKGSIKSIHMWVTSNIINIENTRNGFKLINYF